MKPANMVKTLLSIAGFDPSGGAGTLMDIAVFEAAGFRGMAVLTALTVQNTREVRRIMPLPPRMVMDQYCALARDVSFRGAKIGMLGSGKNLDALGRILVRLKGIPVVVDPVFRSSSGADLLPAASVGSFLKTVRGRASLLTPNLDEAVRLSGLPVGTPEEMLRAARLIFDRTEVPCLVKGGHLPKILVNILYDGRKTVVFRSPRVPKDVHGTGCFLSSSILASLARGASLSKACSDATDLTHEAIRKAVRQGYGRYLLSPK
jgi:hydroxymethylpyrimidine/phosphomethylpyrimidine kinase